MTGNCTVAAYSDGLLPSVHDNDHEVLQSMSIGKKKLGLENGTEARMGLDGYGKRGLSEVSAYPFWFILFWLWCIVYVARCDSSKWRGTGKIKWKDQRSMMTVVPLPLVSFFLRPIM